MHSTNTVTGGERGAGEESIPMLISNHSANTDDTPATHDVHVDRASLPASPSSAAMPPPPRHRLSRTSSTDTDASTTGAPLPPRHRSIASAAANDLTPAAGSKSPGRFALLALICGVHFHLIDSFLSLLFSWSSRRRRRRGITGAG